MFVIKWTNKYSGETGYVESISTKEQHFVNTYDIDSAKRYKSASVAKRMISSLESFGEAVNNDFEIISI